jgi:hypothetical protein
MRNNNAGARVGEVKQAVNDIQSKLTANVAFQITYEVGSSLQYLPF